MKLIFAADSFKGSLSSREANAILERAARTVFTECHCSQFLIADGGEGTLEAVMGRENKGGYQKVALSVTGPLEEEVNAFYLRKGQKAVIEMALASGLTLIAQSKRNPLYTTTRGTGELIRHALENGCTDI